MTTTTTSPIPEAQLGPAERLLDLVLNASAHLWHNRPGVDDGGVWQPRKNTKGKKVRGTPVGPGLFVPAAAVLYGKLLDIYLLNPTLAAHFASYALVATEWRDLKVACSALMLVQTHAGQPIKDDHGGVAFHDDDLREVGAAMILHYDRKSTKMLTPKAVVRIAELLETPAIAELNRAAGFGDPAAKGAPLGRWPKVAQRWLEIREQNPQMLMGLVKAGFKETIKKLARKIGYKPATKAFFEILGWKQKQADTGHRSVGLSDLKLEKRGRFDDLSEAEICEAIVEQRLSYKEVVGRLPKDLGLTPAIMAALLPSLSDRDLRVMTPTLEELGLMADREVFARWEGAIQRATDQRSLQVAKNVKTKELREKLEEAADVAVKKAAEEATADDVHVMFLIDKSGSMQGAIEQSKEALSRILAGFSPDRVHVACFDTMGTVLRPKAASRAAVQHMLAGIQASGGTVHGAAVRALHVAGLRIPAAHRLLVVVVGDEAGEAGASLAQTFRDHGYKPGALAILVNVSAVRGQTVRDCARELGVGLSEIAIAQFDDPYQVPRVIRALLDTPALASATGVRTTAWVEKVMATPLLKLPASA
ncbi:MAG: VWA domain-containing protein [Polyangiaceae bacterium]|nr:VWA domain-containing protein [Polyangiaceae bacterium]